MTDIIVVLILAVIFAVILLYIRKEKKHGVTCIGCPDAPTCHKKNCAGGIIDTDSEQK